MKLYEISGGLETALLNGIDHESGEIDPKFAEVLDSLEMAFDDKVAGIVACIKNLEGEAKVFVGEAEKLAKHARVLSNRAEWLKQYLKENLNRVGKTDGGSTVHRARVQVNSQPTMQVINPLNLVPISSADVDLLQQLTQKAHLRRSYGCATKYEGEVGPWKLTLELSARELREQIEAPENQHVQFVKGTHLRIK